MATGPNADISATKNFFRIFYCVYEIYNKFGVFWKKRSVSELRVTEIINYETGSYLNVQKAIFHARLRQTTC